MINTEQQKFNLVRNKVSHEGKLENLKNIKSLAKNFPVAFRSNTRASILKLENKALAGKDPEYQFIYSLLGEWLFKMKLIVANEKKALFKTFLEADLRKLKMLKDTSTRLLLIIADVVEAQIISISPTPPAEENIPQ